MPGAALSLSLVYLTAAAAVNAHTYLLLDHRNIIDSTNLELVLGTVHKHPANPILTEEKAWELRFDNFQPSVTSLPALSHTVRCVSMTLCLACFATDSLIAALTALSHTTALCLTVAVSRMLCN